MLIASRMLAHQNRERRCCFKIQATAKVPTSVSSTLTVRATRIDFPNTAAARPCR